jgi:hypothetical protein
MLEFQLSYQNERASYGAGRRDTVLASGRGVQAPYEEKTDAVVWSDMSGHEDIARRALEYGD